MTEVQWNTDNYIDYFSPYDQPEQRVIDTLLQLAPLSHSVQRATTASAIQIIERARSLPARFSLRQVFQRYPIHTDEGQTLFQLINQLCHITDQQAQQAFIQECFAAAAWMRDPRRRDAFLSATSSWGLIIANRFFGAKSETSPPVNNKTTIAQKFAKRFASPLIHKTIMQGIDRLTNPLIYAKDWQDAVHKAKGAPLHLRLDCSYAITLQVAQQNQQRYLDYMQQIATTLRGNTTAQKPSIQLELHHFTGPVDFRQTSRLHTLIQHLLPITKAAVQHQIKIIVSSTQNFGLPVLRLVTEQLIKQCPQSTTLSCIGLELSAAEPASLQTLQAITALAQQKALVIPIRLTKERTKPSFSQSAAIHAAFIGLAQYTLAHHQQLQALFVTHNAYTLACLYHLTRELQVTSHEFHHRCGIGHRCQLAFQAEFAGQQSQVQQSQAQQPFAGVRFEAPLGEKTYHHHMILQRLRDISDPQAFLNRMYDEHVTTASLVSSPLIRVKKETFNSTHFWRQQKILPHQHMLSIVDTALRLNVETDFKTCEAQLVQSKLEHRPAPLQQRFVKLQQAHQQIVNAGPLLVKLLIDSMDIPRRTAELQVEAALRQQDDFLQQPLPTHKSTHYYFARGQILWISSAQRPLSPLLEQMTRALLLGNQIIVKPASSSSVLIEQLLQSFWLAGFDKNDCRYCHLSHHTLQELLRQSQSIDTVIFDGLQPQAKALAQLTLQNNKQPPIPFWTTPASSCISTQGLCLIDETASAQELHLLASAGWTLGPMIILTSANMLAKVSSALQAWRPHLNIGPANDRDTHLTASQVVQPFPLQVAQICKKLGLSAPKSISAPNQQSSFFQLVTYDDDNIFDILRCLAQDAQLNRITLLTRMPQRIKRIIQHLHAHEIHLGWPREHTGFVYQGLDNAAFQMKTHIMRHQRLHPWSTNGTFDITDL